MPETKTIPRVGFEIIGGLVFAVQIVSSLVGG